MVQPHSTIHPCFSGILLLGLCVLAALACLLFHQLNELGVIEPLHMLGLLCGMNYHMTSKKVDLLSHLKII